MKTKIQYRNLVLSGILVLIAFLTGCKDMFKDPLKDKETGDDISVLLIDRNFIDTKLVVHLQDAVTQQAINEPIVVQFAGNDASNLITFAGYKQNQFNTSTGFVEVGLDPNIAVSAQNPIELTIVAGGNNYISAPLYITYTSTGIKDIVVNLYPNTSLKSASVGAFGEPFDLKYDGVIQSPKLHFLSDISGSPTGTYWEYVNLYSTTADGTLVCDNLKDNILYSDFGAYILRISEAYGLMPPALPTKNMALKTADYVYSAVLRSGVSLCEEPLTIHVERPNNAKGTGVFRYLITFSDGKTSEGKISCTFPSDNPIEQLYYPTSNPAVSVQLFGDSQYDLSGAVNLTSPCGATASFTATPKAGLKTYKLITRYSCPESSVGIGLSIIGEFRKKGSADEWTSFKFIEGVSELQLVADADYEFRVNIDSEYYNYTLPTNPDKVKTYLQDNNSVDFKFRNLSIVTTDTQVSITTDVQFSAAVCDLIQ